MGKYLKRFETHATYNTYINGQDKVLPNVSYCVDNNEVHYNPWTWAEQYLTFVALEDGTFTFTPQNNNVISYSIDKGETWITENNVNVTTGDNILWKGEMTPNNSGIGTFSSTCEFDVKGNVMSLLYGDDYKEQTDLTGYNYAFYRLFEDNAKLINAEKLSLIATTLATYCYDHMFDGCTSLATAPELPATTLKNHGYDGMFYNCTSLVTAPKLPATTLATYCYLDMFYGCTSLVTAPELPATTLANYCYDRMFSNCTSLAIAPELPATTLARSCYEAMFTKCTSLVTAPELSATTLATDGYKYMFDKCTSLVRTPELPATTLASGCYSYMFRDCTSLLTASDLLTTTLASSCYLGMFQNCTSLVTAPELPATTLVSLCYKYMFNGCTSLNHIKAMFTTTPSNSYTENWVENVAASGTFVKNSAAQWNVTGVHGIPSGWTVQTASE